MNFENCLERIISEPSTHARFLNTLSYLEYIGFRKIIKSQIADEISIEILRHANEESRHAILLKKMAIRQGGADFDKYLPHVLLCGSEALAYFQSLDRAVFLELEKNPSTTQSSSLCYLYVTWLVEERALKVYSRYLEKLADEGRNSPIRGLLNEENKHLTATINQISKYDQSFDRNRRNLKGIEHELFACLIQSFVRALADFANAEHEGG